MKMDEQNFNKMFGGRLLKYLQLRDKNQADLAKAINVSKTSVSNWCKGLKTPRMDKVDMICDYLMINRSDLIGGEKNIVIGFKPIGKNNSLKHIIEYCEKLNQKGIEKLEEYARGLSFNPLYALDYTELLAAHERTDIEITKEGIDHDNAIMDDEEFWSK